MKRLLLPIFVVLFVLCGQAAAQTEQERGRVYWRGQVDDKLQITVKGLSLETKTLSGKAMPEGSFSFTAKLPDAEKTVSVTKIEGRGKVNMIQHPSAENNYTAIVEIHDDRGGSADYLLNIWW